MKRIVILWALFTGFVGNAQDKPKVKGSRIVSEISEYLEQFTSLEIHDGLEVRLVYSSDPYYKLEADDNLLDVVQFELAGNALKVYTTHKISRKKKLEIELGYNSLQNISLIQAKLRGTTDIESDTLQFTSYGSSKADLDFKGSRVNVTMYENSGGNINVDSDEAVLTIRDRVDVNMGLRSEGALVEMNENADAKIEGDVKELEIKLAGASRIKGNGLRAGDIKVSCEDSSDAHIYASKSLEIYAHGSSKIYIYGDPKIALEEFNDKSQLIKK